MLGEGILKGLAETARNFFGSYVTKDRLTTVQYPEERLPQIEAARNFPFLVYDGDDWQQGLRCVACQICEKECPPKCIYIEKSKDKKPDAVGKPQFYPSGLRHRHLRLHELPDLRRGLPVRRHQDGHRVRAEHRRPLRRPAAATRNNSPSPTSITTRFIPRKPPKSMRARRRARQGRSQSQGGRRSQSRRRCSSRRHANAASAAQPTTRPAS